MLLSNVIPRQVFFLTLLCTVILFGSCTSGQTAYNHGKYYEAVIKAIQRLREAPNHKKAKQVLAMAYPRAVELLDFDSKNAIETNSSMKHRTILYNYQQINILHDEIKKSPGALRVIPDPIHKYTELAAVKENAAEETYNAGIQALLQDTRVDAKRAYFLFNEANSLSPGFKESVEMAKQAKFNALLRVLVQPEAGMTMNNDWNFQSVIFASRNNQFVQFYSPMQLQQQRIENIDHVMSITDKRFDKKSTSSQSTTHFSDSVKVGEKEIKGKKYPQYKLVKATLTTFTKVIVGKGRVTLAIMNSEMDAYLLDQEMVSEAKWSASWGCYEGDMRALSDDAKRLCNKNEPDMPREYLYDKVKGGLDVKVRRKLQSFYRDY